MSLNVPMVADKYIYIAPGATVLRGFLQCAKEQPP